MAVNQECSVPYFLRLLFSLLQLTGIAEVEAVNGLEGEASGAGAATENGEVEELFIDDLDDCEMNSYLLSEEESQRKAILWTAAYGEFMEQRAAKRKLKEEEKERSKSKNARNYKPRTQVKGYFSSRVAFERDR